jgi:predicted AlkP superfamily phosphohydrolase/phosphomutase
MSKAALAADHGDFALAERELLDVLRARSSYVCALASKRDFDLVVVNLEATDGSHHFFWQHHDPSHPRHDPAAAKEFGDAIGRVYEATDRELSRLIDAYAPDTVFVVSDHGGAGTNDWVVFTNDWLVEEDLLVRSRKASASAGQRAYGWAKRKMSVPARRALRPVFGKVLEKAKSAALYGDFDWSRSRAYALMQPAVWANMKGREPNGTVHGDELASVAAAVGDATSRLRLPGGQRVFTDSIRSDAVYAGDAPHGPDIVLELAAGMHIRSRNATGKPGHLVRLSDLDMYMPSGVHSPRGMFAAAGAGIARRGRLEEDGDIHQVAPSVLQSLGLTAGGMDAEPFGFVSPRGTGGTTVKQVDDHRPASAAVEPEPDGLNEAEEEEVLERLRGLGYVD